MSIVFFEGINVYCFYSLMDMHQRCKQSSNKKIINLPCHTTYFEIFLWFGGIQSTMSFYIVGAPFFLKYIKLILLNKYDKIGTQLRVS